MVDKRLFPKLEDLRTGGVDPVLLATDVDNAAAAAATAQFELGTKYGSNEFSSPSSTMSSDRILLNTSPTPQDLMDVENASTSKMADMKHFFTAGF